MQATRGTGDGTLLENELVRSGLSKNFYTWVMDMDFVCAGLGGGEVWFGALYRGANRLSQTIFGRRFAILKAICGFRIPGGGMRGA